MTMRRIWCLAAMAAAALGADSRVVGGPYVVNATSRGATVAWIVEGEAVTYQAAGAAPKTSPALKVEYTGLSALQPNTRYDYEVAGGKGWFKTPPSGAEPVQTRVSLLMPLKAAIL